MKPTAYKIGEGERKLLSKDMQEVILAYEEENRNLKNELMEDMKTETKLNEEIKKLKSDLAYERTMLDNVKAEYESTQNVIKKMKAELERYKKQYEHTMGED